MKPFGDQQMGDHVIDVERVDEHLAAAAELFGPPLRFLGLGQNVDVPSGQLRGEPNVLAAPADRQAQLVVGHDDLDAALLLVHHHLGDLGRGERVDDESRRVGRPRDDVDLLALQFADDRLDPAAAHADAGADRIDAAVARDDRDLGAAAGVARHRLDLDDAVVDLRHFLREQLGHELRVGARQKDLRAARLLAHVVDIGAHPLALAEALARQQFVAAQHRLGPAEIDDDIAELDPLDEPVDDLADAVLELEELPLALGVAHLLDDDLLCGLRGDAAKIDRRQRVGDEIADLGLGVQPLRLRERDLGRLVLDRIGHLAEAQQPDLAVAAVDLGADVVFLAVFGAARLLDRLLHRLQDFVAVDALVARDGVGDLQQFRAGVGGGAFHGVLEFRASDSGSWPTAARACERRGAPRAGRR